MSETHKIAKTVAFALSVLPLLLLLYVGNDALHTTINMLWISSLSIHFHLHIDTLSLLFLYLVNVIIPISILSESSNRQAAPLFYGLILFSQWLLIGFFTAQDLFLFTFFWEAMLLPLYFLMTMWGGKERKKAALQFIVYMIAGSVFMIAAVIALYSAVHTFDIATLALTAQTLPHAALLCAIFLLAFAVKTPLFPFHAWLPSAYCQSTTAVTILLSAILSKAGVYGIVRIVMELFPQYIIAWGPILLNVAIIGMLYGALAAWAQKDFKRLISYSSFSHVNFLLAALFVWNDIAYTGAILQVLNHAITITGLFLVAWWLEERLGSTLIGDMCGLAKYFPRLCWFSIFFILSAIALPGLNGFVSEVLILFGIFTQNPWKAAVLGLTVIFSVIYMLRWIHSTYFQTPSAQQKSWTDLQYREILVAIPLIVLVFWIGIYPAPILRSIHKQAQELDFVYIVPAAKKHMENTACLKP